MNKDDLSPKAQENFSVQSYEKSPNIDGVILKEINSSVDDGGYFMELARMQQGVMQEFEGFEVKQVNYSQVLPGTVKAYHLHLNQEDIWFIPPHERLLVVLNDQRKGSSTEGTTMRFVMGGGKPRLLYIPRGVVHGVTNIGKHPAAIIYFVNQQFNPENPDEGRLPWDFLGKEIWEITKG